MSVDANAVFARVPLEIWDYILGPQRDDHKTLGSCALTCHAWLSATRHYLFRTVKLTKSSAADFKSFVYHTPAIGCYVRVLYLDVDADPDFTFLEHLPNVTELTLSDWLLRHAVNDALSAYLKRINTLELYNFNMLVPELPRILSACHAISSLSLRNVYWPLNVKLDGGRRPQYKVPSDLPTMKPAHVQSLSLSNCARFVYSFLAQGTAFAPFPRLTLALPAPVATQAFLDHCGRSLTSLKLVLMHAQEKAYDPLSLAAHTELLSLTIEHKRVQVVPKWLDATLKSVCSSRLRELKIIIQLDVRCGTRHKEWQSVLDVLGELPGVSSRPHVDNVDYSNDVIFTLEMHYPSNSPPAWLEEYRTDTLSSTCPSGVRFNVVAHAGPEEAPATT